MPLSSLGSLHVSLLFPEAGTVLVCHRGRWLLHQPPTGFEDGPVGQVSGGPGETGGVQEGPWRGKRVPRGNGLLLSCVRAAQTCEEHFC